MLKIGDYEFLLILHESKNLTQAARTLYISQPALTKRLQRIEQELGTILVSRNAKGIQFTMEGEYVLEYARKEINDYRELKMALNNIRKKNATALNLASSNTIATEVLPTLLKTYQKKYPDIQINLRALGTSDTVSRIYDGMADVGFVCSEQSANLESVFIRREYMTLVYYRPVRLEELPFIPRIDFITNQNSSRMISNWWNNNFDVPPYITMNVADMQTCINLVNEGLGYAILMDEAACKTMNVYRERLKSDGKLISRNDYMIYPPESLKKANVAEFIQFCQGYFLDCMAAEG